MSFKPKEVHWFETKTPRNFTVYAIEALAQTSIVEFFHQDWDASAYDTELIRSQVDEFASLSNRFNKELPASLSPPETHEESPEHLAEAALKTLRKWCADLLCLQKEFNSVFKEIDELEILKALLEAIPDHDIDFSWIDQTSDILYKKLYSCPTGAFNHPSGKNIVVEIFPAVEQDFILMIGTPDHLQIVEAASTLVGCKKVNIPSWLTSQPTHRVDDIIKRISSLRQKLQNIETRLTAHKEDEKLKQSLSSVRLLLWIIENPQANSAKKEFCHISGWTSAESPKDLEEALNKAGIETEVSFSEKPVSQHPPVHMPHAWWIQPFSLFVDFAGTPASDEIDPTPLLALIVPLLFGYMFPDVGHGLVLVIAGLVFNKKIPQAGILIPCGLASAGFGFIFGDVFGRHDIIDAIWLNPMDDPLKVIAAPLVLGALILTTGLIFSGIEAHWRGELKKWFQTEAPVLLLYLVLIPSIFWIEILWLTGPVLIWFSVGNLFYCTTSKALCLLYSFGNLFESILRLGLNSISFMRVGVFALAHSGASHAANMIADMIDNTLLFIIFLIFSHAFIIGFEGLIVFIQTTRLILFEFFSRFLKAEGRVFKPVHGLTQ